MVPVCLSQYKQATIRSNIWWLACILLELFTVDAKKICRMKTSLHRGTLVEILLVISNF